MQDLIFQLQRFTETITLTEDGDKYIVTYGNNDKILYGLGGDDSLDIAGGVTSVTIDCGSGDDEIWSNLGTGISIFGGDGDDYINPGFAGRSINTVPNINNSSFNELDDNTVRGGAGNDKILSTFPAVIQFASGDGDDTVSYGVGQSTLQVDGDYYTLASGVDTIVYVGVDSIRFEGTDIGGVENYGVAIVGGNQIFSDNFLQKNDNAYAYTYSGGNKIIQDFSEDEEIVLASDFTGIDFSSTTFVVNSSTGSLKIKNAANKYIKVKDSSGNNLAEIYYSQTNMTDESIGSSVKSDTPYKIFIGKGSSKDTIRANGSVSTSLWGGSGDVSDVLFGGEGQDIFFYGKNDGNDKIKNAGSNDIVNLYDVSLADITSADISGSKISVGFNTGSNLQINSAENLSATFKLSGGSFKFNHSTNSWQNA